MKKKLNWKCNYDEVKAYAEKAIGLRMVDVDKTIPEYFAKIGLNAVLCFNHIVDGCDDDDENFEILALYNVSDNKGYTYKVRFFYFDVSLKIWRMELSPKNVKITYEYMGYDGYSEICPADDAERRVKELIKIGYRNVTIIKEEE